MAPTTRERRFSEFPATPCRPEAACTLFVVMLDCHGPLCFHANSRQSRPHVLLKEQVALLTDALDKAPVWCGDPVFLQSRGKIQVRGRGPGSEQPGLEV